MKYAAFISYNQSVDSALARALRDGLQSFAKPWYRLREIRVFQDTSNLALDPSLWGSVSDSLDRSEYLILLASPAAAASEWVNREIGHWLEHRSLESILLLLTDGDLDWNQTEKRFDAAASSSLPPALRDAYSSEPLYLDLRGLDRSDEAIARDPRFLDAVASVSAVLRGRPKDELIGADLRNHRRALRLAWTAGSAILVLAIMAGIAAWLADQQRREAEQQRRAAEQQRDLANARLLGVQAEQLLGQNPDLLTRSVLLSIEALRAGAGPPAERALRSAVALLPRRVAVIDAEPDIGRAGALAFDPAGNQIAIGGDRALGFYDALNGEKQGLVRGRVEELNYDAAAGIVHAIGGRDLVRISPSGLDRKRISRSRFSRTRRISGGAAALVATATRDEAIEILRAGDGGLLATLELPDSATARDMPQAFAFDREAGLFAAMTQQKKVHLWALPSGGYIKTLEAPPGPSYSGVSIAISPDAARLVSNSGENRVEIWDLEDDRPLLGIDHGSGVHGLEALPDARGFVSYGGNAVRIWDYGGRELYRIPTERLVTRVAISTDARLIAVAERNGPVSVWDLRQNQLEAVAIPEVRANAVALSPDRRLLATAEDHGIARVWDLSTGQATHRFEHPPDKYTNYIARIAWSADGSRLTAVNGSGQIIVRDLAAGTELARVSYAGSGSSGNLARQGELVAGSGDGGDFVVWNILTGERLARIDAMGSSWRPIFSPDASLLAVKRKSELYVYDIATGRQVAYLENDPRDEITAVRYSPDSRLVAAGGEDKQVAIRDIGNDRLVKILPVGERVRRLEFSADGKRLALATDGGDLRVYATADWSRVAEFSQAGPLADLALGNRRLAAADEQRRVRIWDIDSGELIREINHEDDIQEISLRPGSDWLGIAGRRTLRAVSIASGESALQHKYLAGISAFRQNQAGNRLAVGLTDGALEVWDLSSGEQALALRGSGTPDDVDQVAFNRGGRRLVTVAQDAHVWDLGRNIEISRIQARSLGGAAVFSADGSLIAAGGSSSQLGVWSVATGEQVFAGKHDVFITSVAFSPDASLVAAVGPSSGLARVWRVADAEVVRNISIESSGGLFRVAFHPDGERLLTAGRDGSVRFWNLASGAEIDRILQGKPVYGMDITSNGRFLATTSADYSVRVWDLGENRLISLLPHANATRSIAISEDADLLVTTDDNGLISAWQLDRESLIDDACNRIGRNLSWSEWRQYFADAPYRKTCEHHPLHASFVHAAFELAQNLQPAAARAQLTTALELEPALGFDVDERLLSIARTLDRQGVRLAEQFETARAAQRFEAATLAIGEAAYDYLGRAAAIAIEERLEKAIDLAQKGETVEAMNEFRLAAGIDPEIEIDASAWNSLCWFGLVFGEAEDVLEACDTAVATAADDMNGFYADSRAVARILTGDYRGAIEDFRFFLRWAADKPALAELSAARSEWISALEDDINPLADLSLAAHSNWMSDFREHLGLGFYWVTVE